jgi:photosystem II stability/assembly factor-like uncharacterized protein
MIRTIRLPLAACLTLSSVLGAGVPAAAREAAAREPAASTDPVASKESHAKPYDAAMFRGMKARGIGPAVMGGRVSEIALDPKSPSTFYVALGTGGLMKTSDDGGTFQPIFEKEAVASMGAVAVAPSDPKVVYAGTGEANDRNSSAWGRGVYRSSDSGATWTKAGLTASRSIARIVVHPTEPDTLWVAAMGDLWAPGGERGLYKTTDGGKTWKAVLQAEGGYADRVGCGDVALDPSDPNVLYAALYARRRTPWSFVSGPDATDGKDLGGIFKSADGGRSWKKLGGGLPGRTGRTGLAVFPGNPKILYAVVGSDEGGTSGIDDLRSRSGGVFRSEDAGTTWMKMNSLAPRSFYFSQIRIDPRNDQRVYLLGYALHVSDDAGRSFREDLFKKVHPDCHALAIDPGNPERLILGTDGGVYQSQDRGKGWAFLDRFDGGEYYRINLDDSDPYRICGGLQDNSNWVGPSRTPTKEGIRNFDWAMIEGGDGFSCVFDPEDPDVIYAESQGGEVYRYNLANGQLKELRPTPEEGQSAFRFHWNAPLIGSRHSKGVLYLGGNRVFRLERHGERWRLISPDLSTDDHEKTRTVGSGAETYGVVYTLAESPLKPGMLWAGTDDGKVWVTEDEGGRWTDLTANLPSAARGQWINRIEPGAADARVAYIAVDAHRTGNLAPLAYRTGDGGRSWRGISGDLPAEGPVKVVREDPKNPDLLYAGTEFGLFVSLDRGERWVRFGDLPTVAVDDLMVHPRDLDLVIATHGRSLFIVDDLRPIEQITPAIRNEPAYLFTPRPAFGVFLKNGWVDSGGNAVFRGANPPEGALLSVWVKEFTGEPVKLAIANALGQPVAELTLPGTPGINRTNWDLKPTKEMMVEYGGMKAKFVPSGQYEVTLTYGAIKQTQKLRVDIAPGIETR